MIESIAGILTLFAAQTLLPPILRYIDSGLHPFVIWKIGIGPRDHMPPQSTRSRRAERALYNLFEALPIVLTLFLLCIILDIDSTRAVFAAQLILVSRCLYVFAYLKAPDGIRSFFWFCSWVGICLLIAEIKQQL